jgi:PPOX class probable F420-dependent enzyme
MAAPAGVPDSHRDLLERPICAVLATVLSSGFPQANVVWCGFDGTNVLVSTTAERTKARNMAARSVATILVVDPIDGNRFIQIRGRAEIMQDGALNVVDQLTDQYTEHARYYGGLVPAAQQDQETRILCKIRPTRVTVDAIHA